VTAELLGPGGTRFLYIFVAGVVATYIWRAAGVYFAGRIDETSEIFQWVRAVATALVAGLIARLVLFPTGALAETPVWLRLGAGAVGFAVALIGRRWTVVGIMTAEVILIAGWFILRGL